MADPQQIDENALAIVPVKDMAAAKNFYENILGLRLVSSDEDGLHYKYGNSLIVVYKEPAEDIEREIVVTWQVKDLAALVASLKAKGVNFEHYDMHNVTYEGDIHIFEDGVRCVWFTDPEGNIIEVDEAK